MRKLLYISLIALAGCTTSLSPVPQPVVTGSDLSDYFWPDSTQTYQYQSSSGDMHTVSVISGGAIIDKDQNSGANTTLAVTKTGTSYTLSGFSHTDLFGFDSSLEVVSDTMLPGPWMETIRSIAAVNFGFSGKVFASSDSVLYQIVTPGNTLSRMFPMPSKGLALAEDVTGSGLYAFQKGGSNIFWTSTMGLPWLQFSTPPGKGITAFASDNPDNDHFAGNLFWVACGPQLYLFSKNGSFTLVPSPLTNIVALEAEGDGGVFAAGDNGQVYDISRVGSATVKMNVGFPIRGMASNYVTTSSGIFDFTHSSPPIVSGSDSAIYSTPYSMFVGRNDGSVDHFSLFGPPEPANLPAPAGTPVIQFAYPTQPGFPNPNSGIYALAGTHVYYRQDSVTWMNVNQLVSTPPSFKPGTLTLLSSDTNWVAGFIERSVAGAFRGYAYEAASSGPFSQLNVGGATYNNVLIVSYTSKTNGAIDAVGVPQYNIYFEKGVGPVVIVQMENGLPTTTTLVK